MHEQERTGSDETASKVRKLLLFDLRAHFVVDFQRIVEILKTLLKALLQQDASTSYEELDAEVKRAREGRKAKHKEGSGDGSAFNRDWPDAKGHLFGYKKMVGDAPPRTPLIRTRFVPARAQSALELLVDRARDSRVHGESDTLERLAHDVLDERLASLREGIRSSLQLDKVYVAT